MFLIVLFGFNNNLDTFYSALKMIVREFRSTFRWIYFLFDEKSTVITYSVESE